MYKYEIKNGTKITSPSPLDVENPLVNSILEYMSNRGKEAKKKPTIISSVDFKPLTGKRLDMAQKAFDEYFGDEYTNDDLEE